MHKPIVLIRGEKRNKLTLIAEAEVYVSSSNLRYRRIVCKCDCGNMVTIRLTSFRSGNTKSCGCQISPLNKNARTKHGKSHTPLNAVHSGVKDRCNNKRHKQYPDYGGRGIVYDPKWENFTGFLEDMEDSYRPGLSLDRIDNNGPYSKNNCRWATPKEQARNRRSNRMVEWQGKSIALIELCDQLGLNYRNMRWRLGEGGMTLERALSMNPITTFKKQI